MSATTYDRPLSARRSGSCPACGEAIEVGDPIVRGEAVRGYVHEGCRSVSAPEREDREVTATTPGVYERDGVAYVVKQNRAKTGTYAKRIVEIGGTRTTEAGTFVNVEFEYVSGAIYDLRPEDRMTGARAKELTLRYGRCIVCGAYLSDGTSVEQGIGPVCVKNFPDLVEERKAIAAEARAAKKAAKVSGSLPAPEPEGESAYLAYEAERATKTPPPIAGAAEDVALTLSELAARIEARELIALALREVVQERDVPPADAERALRTFDRLVDGFER